MMNKIIILCMGKKGYQSISDIVNAINPEIISFVVGARDLQIQYDYYDEIVNFTKKHNIDFYDRDDDWNKNIENEYIFAISWRWLINNINNKRLIIAHDSLLPKYRGFAPLVNMLINKEQYIGVTFLYANSKYDEGDIILQKKLAISYPIKIAKAIDLISQKYSEGLIQIIRDIRKGKTIEAYSQDNSKATFSLWRDEDDYLIDFNNSANDINRFIDAVGYPYKGATAYIKDEKVIILDAEVCEDKYIENRSSHLGKVIFIEHGQPIVVCKYGLLKLKDVRSTKNGKSILPLKKFRIRFQVK